MSELLALLLEFGPLTLAAAGLAHMVLVQCGQPWTKSCPARRAAGWALGVGLGFFLGCWLLNFKLHWPPREDRDRFLLVLLPTVVLVEMFAAVPRLPRVLALLLRLAVAAGAARILLHDTIYLIGPGPDQWTPEQSWLILAALAAILAFSWLLLAWLAHSLPGRALPLALAMSCAAAGLTIMLSGYLTGGPLGFPLAGALLGGTSAALALRSVDVKGVVGVGLVGLFALLIMGRYFGELSTVHALILFHAPLLCWLPALPGIRKMPAWIRGPLQVLLVALPLGVVVLEARQTFLEATGAQPGETGNSTGIQEPSAKDYEDYKP